MVREIDSRLTADSSVILESEYFVYLLKKDENPWVVVAAKKQVVEFFELETDAQKELLKASNLFSQLIKNKYHCTKMNIANLGNIVADFHWHIIGRFSGDRAWPNPIWGTKSVLSERADHDDLRDYLEAELKRIFL